MSVESVAIIYLLHDGNNMLNKITKIIIIFGLCFLLANILLLTGSLKERADKECVDPTSIMSWEKTLEIARSICIDGFASQKTQNQIEVEKLQGEIKHWKDAYLWLKKQNEENSITQNNP